MQTTWENLQYAIMLNAYIIRKKSLSNYIFEEFRRSSGAD